MPKPTLNLVFNRGLAKKEETFSPKPQFKAPVRKPKSDYFTRDLDFEPLEIKKMHISFISEEEIDRLKVVDVKVSKKDLKKDSTRIENINTVSDNRMFPQRGDICSTCDLPSDYCPGHLGRINLKVPVIKLWAYSHVISILESICHSCSTLLINPEVARKYKSYDRLKKIALASKKLPCRNRNCPDKYDKPNPELERKDGSVVRIGYKDSNDFLSSTKILFLLKNMNDEDLKAIGFDQSSIYHNHPKNMLWTSLVVIPENNRPTSSFGNGEIKPSPLTNAYNNNIIIANNALSNGEQSDKYTPEILGDYVSDLYSRNTDNSAKSGGYFSDSNKNIKELMMKKTGIFKSAVQAKRCDGTARTVLGPGGNEIPFGYIGLPAMMSKIYVKEIICEKNIDYYNNLIRSGVNLRVTTSDSTFNTSKRPDHILTLGTVISRPLRDGDPIIFNRNPTLHKHSMMGYIVKMTPGLTIGLHSSVTTPHNADFDGDEGNINVCPDYKSRAEIMYLAGCWNNVIGSQFSRPMMGLVFNSITSAYLMSRYGSVDASFWDRTMKTVFARSARVSSLKQRASKHRPDDADWRTGPALFSALLPENFYYNDGKVLIKEGILVRGNLTKSHVGPSTGSIVHMIHHYYGDMAVTQFISEGQLLLDAFIYHIGFSVGYADCAMPNEESQVREIVDQEIERVQAKLRELEPMATNKYEEIRKFYDQTVQNELNKIKFVGMSIIEKALPDTNSLKIMAVCGSKGKEMDIAQVIGIVGQQFVEGKRPERIFNHGLRFLPAYDVKLEGREEKITDRGFVDRPLGKGMRPGQFFAHMMASRIGLIDTALGTATTGYSHRKIVKALEDVRFAYNNTISGDLGQIIQYAGGYDSYDPSAMIEVKCPGYGKIWSPVDIVGLAEMLNSED